MQHRKFRNEIEDEDEEEEEKREKKRETATTKKTTAIAVAQFSISSAAPNSLNHTFSLVMPRISTLETRLSQEFFRSSSLHN